LAGTYLSLIMVIAAARLPGLERVLGQDRLLRWHRSLVLGAAAATRRPRGAHHTRLRRSRPSRLPVRDWLADHHIHLPGADLLGTAADFDGTEFVGHSLAQSLWLALWFATSGVVILCRIGLPIGRSLYYGLESWRPLIWFKSG
jgi:hypothetical protein